MIRRTKVVRPLRHAVRFVDDGERDAAGDRSQVAQETLVQKPFRRDEEHLKLSRPEFVQGVKQRVQGLVRSQRRAGERRRQPPQLIRHQREQRRHDEREPREQKRGELIRQRFPRACGKQREGGAAAQDASDDLELPGAEALVPERPPQDVRQCVLGRVPQRRGARARERVARLLELRARFLRGDLRRARSHRRRFDRRFPPRVGVAFLRLGRFLSVRPVPGVPQRLPALRRLRGLLPSSARAAAVSRVPADAFLRRAVLDPLALPPLLQVQFHEVALPAAHRLLRRLSLREARGARVRGFVPGGAPVHGLGRFRPAPSARFLFLRRRLRGGSENRGVASVRALSSGRRSRRLRRRGRNRQLRGLRSRRLRLRLRRGGGGGGAAALLTRRGRDLELLVVVLAALGVVRVPAVVRVPSPGRLRLFRLGAFRRGGLHPLRRGRRRPRRRGGVIVLVVVRRRRRRRRRVLLLRLHRREHLVLVRLCEHLVLARLPSPFPRRVVHRHRRRLLLGLLHGRRHRHHDRRLRARVRVLAEKRRQRLRRATRARAGAHRGAAQHRASVAE
eukprot:31398-Pelagococcus_subviridis.AAC.12